MVLDSKHESAIGAGHSKIFPNLNLFDKGFYFSPNFLLAIVKAIFPLHRCKGSTMLSFILHHSFSELLQPLFEFSNLDFGQNATQDITSQKPYSYSLDVQYQTGSSAAGQPTRPLVRAAHYS